MGQEHSHSKANGHGLSLDSILNGDHDTVENTATHDEAPVNDDSAEGVAAKGFCVECEGEEPVISEPFSPSLILSRSTSTTFLRDMWL